MDPHLITHGRISFLYKECSACRLCAAACPAGAITDIEGKPVFTAGRSECIFCGNCQAVCPKKAIVMEAPYRYSGLFKTIDHGEPKPPRL